MLLNDQLTDWNFADWSYRNGFDQMSSLLKILAAGWSETLSTESMLSARFAQLIRYRIIPPVHGQPLAR
ncbi:MAG: hypothetical protein AB7O44_24230 [Hyphomicrobiaceae bacterium]